MSFGFSNPLILWDKDFYFPDASFLNFHAWWFSLMLLIFYFFKTIVALIEYFRFEKLINFQNNYVYYRSIEVLVAVDKPDMPSTDRQVNVYHSNILDVEVILTTSKLCQTVWLPAEMSASDRPSCFHIFYHRCLYILVFLFCWSGKTDKMVKTQMDIICSINIGKKERK